MPEQRDQRSGTRFRTEAMGVTIEFAPEYSSFDIVEGGPPLKMVRVSSTEPATKAAEQ